MRPFYLFGFIFSVIFACTSVCRAENLEISFVSDSGWVCHPAVQEGGVVGFLLENLDANTGPNSFDVAWYERHGDDFTMAFGWKNVDVLEAALKLVIELEQPKLFDFSSLRNGIANAFNDCGAVAQAGVAVLFGLAVDDPYQVIAPLLSPADMEMLVSFGAAGASTLSAKEVDLVEIDGEISSVASKELLGLSIRVEADIAGQDGFAVAVAWFCIPGTYCRSSSVIGQCLVSGFGNGSCSGCRYTCTVTTVEACAYISITCNVGPATTTTTTSTINKSCRGDASNCPPRPPPGC